MREQETILSVIKENLTYFEKSEKPTEEDIMKVIEMVNEMTLKLTWWAMGVKEIIKK